MSRILLTVLVILFLTSISVGVNVSQFTAYADDDYVVEFETVNITVTGPVNHTITISSDDSEHTVFLGGINDNPDSDTSGPFNDIITFEKKIKRYTVYFTDSGDYRIRVVDTVDNMKIYVDITVERRKLITFDAPHTCAIGDFLLTLTLPFLGFNFLDIPQ